MIRKIAVPVMWMLLGAAIAIVSSRLVTRNDVPHESSPEPAVDPDDRRALDARVDHLQLDRVPLPKAIAALADKANVSLAVDWEQLDNHVGRLVSLDLRDVTVDRALEAILQTDRYSIFRFTVHDGILCIGSDMESWPRESETRAYDIRQLVEDYIAFDLRPPSAGSPRTTAAPTEQACREAANRFAKLLDQNVSRYQYVGSITELAGRLFITAPREEHVKIRRLFEDLRRVSRQAGALDAALGSPP